MKFGKLAAIISSLFFVACSSGATEQDRQAKMAAVIEERVEMFKDYKTRRCKEEATRRAKAQVDSFFIELDRLNEGIESPYRVPTKPVKPDWLYPVDTADVEPIFGEEARDTSSD